MAYSLPGSSIHGILQARKLEWVVMPSSRESSQPRAQACMSYVSYIGGWVLWHSSWQTFIFLAATEENIEAKGYSAPPPTLTEPFYNAIFLKFYL